MSDILHNCGRLQIRKSPIEGWGVFATEEIKTNEVLEEVPFVLWPRHTNLSKNLYDFLGNMGFLSEKEKFAENLRANLGFKIPEAYYFKWNTQFPLNGEQISYTVLPLGYGPIYNSRNAFNNAGWTVKEKTFVFHAVKDIQKDEEICTFFGYYLDQIGNIFPCQNVFNLALETNKDKIAKVLAIRFGTIDDFQQSQSNPSYQRTIQLLNIAQEGLRIYKLIGLSADGIERFGLDFGLDSPLSLIYGKLQELKNNFPLLKIHFEYTDKNDGLLKKEEIIYKK